MSGAGVHRAAARLRASKRVVPMGVEITRQQRREITRNYAKALLSWRKESAMRAKLPGGAAAVS